MTTSYLKRQYTLFGREDQSFTGFVAEEIENRTKSILKSISKAPKDHQGKPVLYTVLRHVSASGMSRSISVHYFDLEYGDMRQLNYECALLLGLALDEKHEGVKIKGAGMDMGFALIYDLSSKLFSDGYAISQRWL